MDLASGALLRARAHGTAGSTHGTVGPAGAAPAGAAPAGAAPVEGAPGDGWGTYDVARIRIAADDEPLDPARPETIVWEQPPERLGRMRRRPARRVLRRLASPERPGATLLGTHGPSIPYVDLDGTAPSLMLIAVSSRSLEAFALSASEAALAFSWSGTRHQLRVADARLRSAVLATAPHSLAGGRLSAALGGKPSVLLVGLGVVRGGHAPKVVLAALAP